MAEDLIENCDFIRAELEKDEDIPPIPMPKEISYYSEIYSIMYACGDVKNPLESSAKLMYNILQDQMALLITNAEDIMKLKKGKRISHEEVLFLMRKNKVLLKRLLMFLFVEDAKSCLLPSIKNDGFSLENGERVSQCLKYLSFIEKFTGDLTFILKDESLVDHVYMKRLKRRDLMAESMTAEEYESFYEYTLKITFCQKYTTEVFKKWLQQCSCTTTDITQLALSIIHFLARETIAGIVDKALEIKSRKHGENDHFPNENFSNHPVDLHCELEHNLVESENNLHFPLSGASEDSSYNKNYNIEDSSGAPVENKIDKNNIISSLQDDMQETSLFSSTSRGICETVKCPVARNTQEKNRIIENSIIDNSLNDIQMKDTAKVSYQSDQNSSPKSCVNSKSDLNSETSSSKRKAKIPSHSHKNSSSKNSENCKSADASSSKRKAKILSHSHKNSSSKNSENCKSTDASSSKRKAKILSNSCKKSSSKSCENSKSANVPSSKSKLSNHFLVPNQNLHDSVTENETNCDMHDNSESNCDMHDNSESNCDMRDNSDSNCDMHDNSESDNKFPNACCSVDEDSRKIKKKSKKIKKKFNFSVNFQNKPFSICCDGSKTFEFTSSPAETDRFTDTKISVSKTTVTEDKDLATSCFIEYIEEPVLNSSKTKNSASRSLLSDFGKHTEHCLFITPPIKMDYRVYWFPEEAITPEEIQAAFMHYQHSLPMSYLMKTKLPLPPKKINLVCLANPGDFM